MVDKFRLTLLLSILLCWQAPSAAAADSLSLEQYAGQVVVLDFWASWCVPCRRSFPWLNAMHDQYAEQGLVIIGVNLDAERTEALDFLEEYPARFAIHYDTEAVLAREWGIEAMPSSIIIGRDGELVTKHLGFKVKKQAEYESVLVEALARGVRR